MKKTSLFLLIPVLLLTLAGCGSHGVTSAETEPDTETVPVSETEEPTVSETAEESGTSFAPETASVPETIPETNPVPETAPGTAAPEPEETVPETEKEPEKSVTVSVVGTVPGTGILYRNPAENGRYLVCIDAGHQGLGMNDTEPNAPGSDVMKAKVSSGTAGAYTGKTEHELNLKVALCLRDLLLKRGYSVLMVRESADVAISNAERAILANENGASILIRIHANGASDPSVSGAMTLCQTPFNPDNGFCYPEARRLSETVLSAFCETTGMKYLYISETDTMTGINWCKVPATIVEMGFMSNEHDDRYMAESSFPLLAAKGIAEGVDRYYE